MSCERVSPVPSVRQSRVQSWNTANLPSVVGWTSSSTKSAPAAKARLHGGDGVLDLVDDRFADHRRGATVVGEAGAVEILMHAAMRDEPRFADLRGREPRRVPKIDGRDDRGQADENLPKHDARPLPNVAKGAAKCGDYLARARLFFGLCSSSTSPSASATGVT